MQAYVGVRLVQNDAIQAIRQHVSKVSGRNTVYVHLHKAEEGSEQQSATGTTDSEALEAWHVMHAHKVCGRPRSRVYTVPRRRRLGRPFRLAVYVAAGQSHASILIDFGQYRHV